MVEIHYPGLKGIHGKHVVLEPEVRSGAIFRWTCYTPDGAEKYLPGSCRGKPEAAVTGAPPQMRN